MTKCNFNSYTLDFYMTPEGKPRPRKGKYGNMYSPKTRFGVALEFFARLRPGRPQHIKCALRVDCIFRFKRPKSTPKYQVYKSTKFDIDNLQKEVFDSLERAQYFKNDSQIAASDCVKIWVDDVKNEGVKIIISRLECRTKKGC